MISEQCGGRCDQVNEGDNLIIALQDENSLQEDGVRQTRFDGDIETQGLTPDEYDARLSAADERYAHLLNVLTGAVHNTREQRSGAAD